MKILRGLQSENHLGGYRILGDTPGETLASSMIAKLLFKTLKFSKLFNILAFVLISNQRSVAYFVSQCAIA